MGLYSSTGLAQDCVSVPAGQLFYMYNYPNKWSSNTGEEARQSEVLYFVVDEDGGIYFVIVREHGS
jgi:hypothetical protein